jgi:hypothetical protein
VATANDTSDIVIDGLVVAIYVRYNDSPPAGTADVTIETAGNTTPAYNLLVLTDAATDGLFIVRDNPVDTAGSSQASNWDLIPVYDNIKVTIAQANNGDSVDVWFLLAT